MLWNIIADSSSDLVQKDYASSEYGFETVPLKISVDDRQFTDNEDINVEQLLSDMNKSKTASGSACPSPDEFKTAFMKADNTLCITISAALSGTFSCACVARDMVHETNPEKNICIINSKATAGVLELFVRKAIMLIGQKLPFEVVAERLQEYIDGLRIITTLENFGNLIKNGRMSAFTGFVATALKIRAIACANLEGTIDVLKKVRGEKKTLEEMVKLMADLKKEINKDVKNSEVIINHCQNPEGALLLKDLIKKTYGITNVTIRKCRGLTTFYAMNNGLILSF